MNGVFGPVTEWSSARQWALVAVAGVLVGLPFTVVRRWSRDRSDETATANSL
jgi:hypothetical protein